MEAVVSRSRTRAGAAMPMRQLAGRHTRRLLARAGAGAGAGAAATYQQRRAVLWSGRGHMAPPAELIDVMPRLWSGTIR
jgi:hypothetical protein